MYNIFTLPAKYQDHISIKSPGTCFTLEYFNQNYGCGEEARKLNESWCFLKIQKCVRLELEPLLNKFMVLSMKVCVCLYEGLLK